MFGAKTYFVNKLLSHDALDAWVKEAIDLILKSVISWYPEQLSNLDWSQTHTIVKPESLQGERTRDASGPWSTRWSTNTRRTNPGGGRFLFKFSNFNIKRRDLNRQSS